MALVKLRENPYSRSDSLYRKHGEIEDIMDEPWLGGPFPEFAGVYPPVIISKSGDTLVLRAELPGMKLKDIDVSISGCSIIIRGERYPDLEDTCMYHRRERDFGFFSRAVGLPENVNPDKCEAFYHNGVLKVLVTTKPDKGVKHINVRQIK